MRRTVVAITIIAFTYFLSLRLPVLLIGIPPITIRLWLTWHKIARTMTGGPAPLLNCHGPEKNIVQNSYAIILRSGYSIEQHKLAVGRGPDIDAVTESLYVPEPGDYFPASQVMYFAWIEDSSLFDSIRADAGVELIECDVQEEIIRGVLVAECEEGLEHCVTADLQGPCN